MNGTADAAKTFFVARAVFERESRLVHRLENLRGALEEEIAEFRRTLVGEKGHWAPSTR
jgi:hypothetical protein